MRRAQCRDAEVDCSRSVERPADAGLVSAAPEVRFSGRSRLRRPPRAPRAGGRAIPPAAFANASAGSAEAERRKARHRDVPPEGGSDGIREVPPEGGSHGVATFRLKAEATAFARFRLKAEATASRRSA
jgi:hypothetical protein